MLPADTVPAIDPGAASPALGTGRALLQDDPVLLRQLLDIPGSHLIVDGYNVSKTAWPTQPLDQQRSRLDQGLSALVGGARSRPRSCSTVPTSSTRPVSTRHVASGSVSVRPA